MNRFVLTVDLADHARFVATPENRFVWKFNPDEPRDDHGRWTEGGATESQPPTQAVDPEHARLEGEATKGTAALEAILPAAIQSADYSNIPGEEVEDTEKTWDDLSSKQQADIKDQFYEESYGNGNYGSSPDASEMDSLTADNLTKADKQNFISDVAATAAQNLEDHKAFTSEGMFGTMHVGVNADTIEEAIAVSDTTVGRDVPVIDDAEFALIKTTDGHDLTEEQSNAVADAIDAAWTEHWNKAVEDYQQSDSFSELMSERESEAISEAWDSMTPKESLQWGIDNNVLAYEDIHGSHTTHAPVSPGAPSVWEWQHDNNFSDPNYAKTSAIAHELVARRFEQLLKERSVPTGAGAYDAAPTAESISASVWDAWKSKSDSSGGLALQLAVQRELGGVSRLSADQEQQAQNWAASRFGYAPGSGTGVIELGMARLQAYVRAQWETTQFILRKAGASDFTAYRAVYLPNDTIEAHDQKEYVGNAGRSYFAIPDATIKRNAASSWTTTAKVANDWSGMGSTSGQERIVLRGQLPRTSAFSLPVFGKNVQGEHEVVVAGTKEPWTWEAWHRRAPEPYEVSFKDTHSPHPGDRGKAAKKPLVIDFNDLPAGGSWLIDAGGKPITPRPARKAVKFNENEPRDSHGEWTDGSAPDTHASAHSQRELTKREKEAVVGYTDGNFSALNTFLRNHGSDPADMRFALGTTEGRIHGRTIQNMDGAVQKGTFEQPATLFRGSGPGHFNGLKPGDTFVDHGYVSTSVFRGIAEGFAADDGKIIEIDAPKGTHALDVAAGLGDPEARYEGERVLGRDHAFKVTAVDYASKPALIKVQVIQ